MHFKCIIFISTLLGAQVHEITTLLTLLTQIAHFLRLLLLCVRFVAISVEIWYALLNHCHLRGNWLKVHECIVFKGSECLYAYVYV